MHKGFVIEFSVDVADDGDDPDIERFRVLVAGEDCQAFEAFTGRFGETRWVEATEPEARGACTVAKYKIVAWALGAYLAAGPGAFIGFPTRSALPNGLTLISIGTVKREA